VPNGGERRGGRPSSSARRAAIRRRQSAAVVVLATLLAAVFVTIALLTQGDSSRATATPLSANTTRPPPPLPATKKRTALSPAALPSAPPPRHVTTLVERLGGRLAAAIEDPAAAAVAGRVILAGGLTPQDTSSSSIVSVRGRLSQVIGQLPGPQHDAAAATLGRFMYAFGGGDGVRQLDHILRIDPLSGRVTTAGHLPAASSDSAAASIGGIAYIVGGYTGTRWLDTIVAFRPGANARVVAHVPTPLRYAAVTSVGGTLVIAGGSLVDGSASRAVYAFDPTRSRVVRIGQLPVATTHAAAASLGGLAYIIGGRGAAPGASAGIVSVDPATRRIRPAGALRTPRRDLAAVALGGTIAVAGGHDDQAVRDSLGSLAPARASLNRVAPAQRLSGRSANVYAAAGANMLTGPARHARALVYVPNSQSNTMDVIDQRTFKIIGHYQVGALPQHVTPSYDLRTLYVDNDVGNSLTPINPRTGKPRGAPIPVSDPYNLYFTPDGRFAIVVEERLHQLAFRNARTMALRHSLTVPCAGVDHMDFTANGRLLLASCEFSGEMVAVDVARQKVVRTIRLPRPGAMPQDVKLSPDGRRFYVADMAYGGVWTISADTLRVAGFIRTGAGAHGLYPSRDARRLYVSNRGAGTVSVISFATRKIVATWNIPSGTPDMGGVSADGNTLWLSGRYRAEVYAIDTRTGKLRARIPVGSGPHGLCVWPQPGRYSLGHTGDLR
jgi:DNA-binding beta-propeller fold protein YncE